MIEEFSKIEREAHKKGLPVIAWIYPRGKKIKNDVSREMIAYSARLGLELGADIVKIKWNNNVKDLSWAVKSAGRTKIVVSGGSKVGEKELIKNVKGIKESKALGLAIGRNVWQHKNPLDITKKIKKIVWA
jgi:class I fructose-bisphosphate aldolase